LTNGAQHRPFASTRSSISTTRSYGIEGGTIRRAKSFGRFW
jgi:hypothetical protein